MRRGNLLALVLTSPTIFAPVATDVECKLGRKTASVTLKSSLASKK